MSWLGFSKNEFKIKFHEAPVRKVAKKYVEWNASGKNKKIVRLLMGTPTKVLGQFSHSFEVCLSIVVLFLHIFFRWCLQLPFCRFLLLSFRGFPSYYAMRFFLTPFIVSPAQWNHNDGCARACKVFLYYAPSIAR